MSNHKPAPRTAPDDVMFGTEATGMVERPANLKGVSNGFALYMGGSTMEPRFYAGELLYIDPNKPVLPGHYVAVELVDAKGLVKRYDGTDPDDRIILRQFNPPEMLVLEAKCVKRMYRIVGSSIVDDSQG